CHHLPCLHLSINTLVVSVIVTESLLHVTLLFPGSLVDVRGSCFGLFMFGPGSFTGEDSAEFHIHGTEAQRRQALHQMAGDLGCIYQDWRPVLPIPDIEAFIDFSEDELIEDRVLNDGTSPQMDHIFSYSVAQCTAAIVFPTAGTTRDVVEVPLDIRGYPVLLNSVEQEGIRRARQRYVFTDTWPLVFVDLMQLPSEPQLVPVFLSGHLKSILEHSSHSRECILILYKSDLISAEHKRMGLKRSHKSHWPVLVWWRGQMFRTYRFLHNCVINLTENHQQMFCLLFPLL
uniref:G domain-containing protein n=1 Tax=Cyprinus carpio carpio TaxID=630221 RepID=A0A9J8BNE4_CYPCA